MKEIHPMIEGETLSPLHLLFARRDEIYIMLTHYGVEDPRDALQSSVTYGSNISYKFCFGFDATLKNVCDERGKLVRVEHFIIGGRCNSRRKYVICVATFRNGEKYRHYFYKGHRPGKCPYCFYPYK